MNIQVKLKLNNPAKQGEVFIELNNLAALFQKSGFQPVPGDVLEIRGQITDSEMTAISDYGCKISSLLYVDSRLYNISTQTLNITLKDRN